MWVVKIGGSLLHSPHLKYWLNVIAEHANGQVIIVPGGGVFADAVREAQLVAELSDGVAHHLALQAMAQFGRLLAGLHPAYVTAKSELEIAERAWQHRPIIWLPTRMVLADESIPKNWQVTSDSLSVWLSHKINAAGLVIVKSAPEILNLQTLSTNNKIVLGDMSNPISASKLSEKGLLDDAFNDFLSHPNEKSSLEVRIIHHTQYADFQNALAEQSLANLGDKVTRT